MFTLGRGPPGRGARTGARASTLLHRSEHAGSSADRRPACWLWGGETTVTLGDSPTGLGGRCQELALAGARVLALREPHGGEVALLAAGTDGLDGPTDAAGAIVDARTWIAIRERGRDPERDLATHNAYEALDAVGALVRTGLTGTNVMDIVIGMYRRSSEED